MILSVMLPAGLIPAAADSPDDGVVEAVLIGDRMELFVDQHLIEVLDNVELRLNRPCPAPSPGGPSGAYMTVIRDGNRYLAYYRAVAPGYDGPKRDGHSGERSCVVVSEDGINWDVPDLGTEDELGYKNVLQAVVPPFTHNFSPFLDTREGVPDEERFKAVGGVKRSRGIHVFASADGLAWRLLKEEPVSRIGNLDSQNVAFWSEATGRYELYYRKHNKPRTVDRIISDDFLVWEHAPIVEPNLDLHEHLYTTQTHPYFRAPHIYIALPTRFTHGAVGGRKVAGNIGSTDIMLMTKRAGVDGFERTFREAFIRPGVNPDRWGSRSNYAALNVVQTGPAEMSVYHCDGTRYALRLDGFASAQAPYEGGELITKPIRFEGHELVLNVSTAVRGGVRVEIQDAAGIPIPGFTLEECERIIDDAVERPVFWKKDSDVSELAGRPIKLRFELQDADIFSYRFRKSI